MSKQKFRGLAFSLLLLAAAPSCSDETPAETDVEPLVPATAHEGWTPQQQAAYEACLERNMAVAVAWEIIEEQCRREVEDDGTPLEPPR